MQQMSLTYNVYNCVINVQYCIQSVQSEKNTTMLKLSIVKFSDYIYLLSCPWFQITGVMTQGRGDGVEWVTAFMMSYSTDAFHWTYVTDIYGNQRVRKRQCVSNPRIWPKSA